jgi:hypothetical protein
MLPFGSRIQFPDPKTWEQYTARRDERRDIRVAHARALERPAVGLEPHAVYRNPEGQLFSALQSDDGRWYLLPHPWALQLDDPEIFYVVTQTGALIECDATARTLCDVAWDLLTITCEPSTE